MIKNVAIIGAGEISKRHLNAYKTIPGVSVVAICDANPEIAKTRAAEFGIPKYCTDYKEILQDASIDAVNIVTPTFTHNQIVVDSLNSGKHVLCEKPPAMTYEEALANEEAAKKAGKLLMYGMVARFNKVNVFLKDYIDSGKIGEIYYAEAARLAKCDTIGGWFRDKSKAGGGGLMDAAIHQLDGIMYFMGYPKVKSVRGFTTYVNKELPDVMNGLGTIYDSVTATKIERTVESFANGYVTFEGGKTLYIKAGHVTSAVQPGTKYELYGENGGALVQDGDVKLLSIDRDTKYFMETKPMLNNNINNFEKEVQHFVACVNEGVECMCPAHQGTELMKVISAIYESAETGKEIVFD